MMAGRGIQPPPQYACYLLPTQFLHPLISIEKVKKCILSDDVIIATSRENYERVLICFS